jgi:hypothetical protein
VAHLPLTIVSVGLILAGSVAAQPYPYAPGGPGYAAQGYDSPGYPDGYAYPPQGGPVPGYAPPGYPVPGYPVEGGPAPGQPYIGPDGLTYVNGYPVYLVDGSYLPLVFVGGLGWGYYGYGHRWFGAPGDLGGRLQAFYPGGRGFPAGGGFRGGPGVWRTGVWRTRLRRPRHRRPGSRLQRSRRPRWTWPRLQRPRPGRPGWGGSSRRSATPWPPTGPGPTLSTRRAPASPVALHVRSQPF